MSPGAVSGLSGSDGRRARLGRERTAAQLRRQQRLEAEAQEQLGPTLGPAGRPMGEAAMAMWRRRQADAYLALPPWRRAWRTWVSWSRLQRGIAVLALAPAWALMWLPLRMLGLMPVEASKAGVAAFVVAAPLAALAPPRQQGRFAVPLPDTGGAPWHGSRRAAALRRGVLLVVAALVAALAVLATVGPGHLQSLPGDHVTFAARQARAATAAAAVDAACGRPVAADARPIGGDRYAVAVAGGGEAQVRLLPVGFAETGPRARVIGTPPCPAP
ncbi:MAG TPA: hypothetical protein PKD59_13975 [Miltoncostaeaceae bacterium]|nr:hypothetical protein [Miltoncostaeaceae bacterium]